MEYTKKQKKGIELMYQVARAIKHPLRGDILQLIRKRGSICVTDIFEHLGCEQSAVSQHLKILRSVDIVLTSRSGKYLYYSINEDKERMLNRIFEELTIT